MKAVILAAGYATRLYPLTLDKPKHLLEVGGRPILDLLLDRLPLEEVDRVYVVTNAKFTPRFREWAESHPAGIEVTQPLFQHAWPGECLLYGHLLVEREPDQ